MKKVVHIALALLSLCSSISSLVANDSEPILHYQVLFSPRDQLAEKLISLIEKENTSIKVAIYNLMHRGIANALINAHKRGVEVVVVVDPYSVKSRSPLKKMQEAGISLYVWNPPSIVSETKAGRKIKKRPPLMHDKFCILGKSLVWTGSFNFTYQATTENRENALILEGSEVAARYMEEFENLKQGGCLLEKF
jgi:phosphatidylserine/phosphatidylglycerophosphate/cardiolipin synthase-like enzyme